MRLTRRKHGAHLTLCTMQLFKKNKRTATDSDHQIGAQKPMPPARSSSAVTYSVDENKAPHSSDQPAEISDSDIDNDEPEEINEETEEQGDENGNDDGNGDDVEEYEEEYEEEEEEYEEIEVEEEEEIIEEIEVEEDDDEEEEEEEEEEGEQLDSSKEVDQKSNDANQCMDFEGDDCQLRSCSKLKSELRLPSNSVLEDSVGNSKFSGPSDEPLIMQEESYVNYELSKCPKSQEHLNINCNNRSRDSGVEKDLTSLMIKNNPEEHNEPDCDSNAPLGNNDIIVAETASPVIITDCQVSDALSMKDILNMESNGVLVANKKVLPMEMQSENDKKQTASRTRSLSPSPEFKDPNKRQAVICDFFAKGWCIRGSSCRFLHVNNKADDAKEHLEGDVAATKFSKGDQFIEGNDTTFSHPVTSERVSAIGEIESSHQLDSNHTSSLLLIEDLSRGVHPSTQQFPSFKDDIGFSFSLKNVATENLRQHWLTTDYGSYASPINSGCSPSLQNSLLPEHRSSSSDSAVALSNFCSGNPSSYMSSLANPVYVRHHSMQASGLDGSCSNSGLFPSLQISAQTRPSFSFSSSWNTSPLSSQKLFDSDRAFCSSKSSSLLQSASPLSGSLREALPLTYASRDMLRYAEHKSKVSSNDWEPSIPFQPSFSITPITASSPGRQYDPLCDSIDLSTTRYRLPFKFSFVSQETLSLHMSDQPACRNSLVSHVLGPECDDDKHKAPFHSKFQLNVVDKSCYTTGKDTFATAEATRGSYVVNGGKGTILMEEHASSTGHSKDVPNTSKIDADCDSRNQNDGPKHQKKVKVDRGRQHNEIEVDQKTDGESRALRHFHGALVEFVKELLKPTWREGHLSKDAHNTIVKRTADKVLSTLQTHQIPATMESAKQYLSSSQPKIAKLVEAYCTKYGKS